MSRGGRRENAGRKSGWFNRETCLLRVPIAISEELMEIAHNLDRERFLENETKSKIIEQTSIIEGMSIDVAMGQLQLLTVPPESQAMQTGAGLTEAALSRRLGVHNTTVRKFRKKKTQTDFAAWSSYRDPEKAAWTYNEELKRYEAISDSVTESEMAYPFH